MSKFKISFFIFLICISTLSFAGFDTNQYTISFGLNNVSYKETSTSTSTSTSTTAKASGAPSIMPLDFQAEHYLDESKSLFARVTIPLLTASKDSYTFVGSGMNFYIKSFSSKGKFFDYDQMITIVPLIRYYVGFNGGIGYLVYSTTTAKKSDINFEVGAHGGTIYSIKDNLSLRGEVGLGRTVGITTSGSVLKLFLGIVRDFK